MPSKKNPELNNNTIATDAMTLCTFNLLSRSLIMNIYSFNINFKVYNLRIKDSVLQ